MELHKIGGSKNCILNWHSFSKLVGVFMIRRYCFVMIIKRSFHLPSNKTGRNSLVIIGNEIENGSICSKWVTLGSSIPDEKNGIETFSEIKSFCGIVEIGIILSIGSQCTNKLSSLPRIAISSFDNSRLCFDFSFAGNNWNDKCSPNFNES